MKTLLLAFLILLAFPVFGQNYRTVIVEKEAYFDGMDFTTNSYRGIKPTTIYANNGDTILKHRFSYENKAFGDGMMAVDTGFMGIKTILRNDGMDIFFNRNADSLFINTKAVLNDNWTFYSFPNGDYYEAKVISHDTQNILGVIDSVKIIRLTAKDGMGNSLQLLYDGFELIISKSMGITQALNFLHFPNANWNNPFIPITVKGLPHLSLGVKDITLADAFDFDIGDEIHYQFYGYSIQYQSLKIKNKWYNATQDIVYYDVFYREKTGTIYGFVGDTTIGYYIGVSELDSLALSVDTSGGFGGILYTLTETYGRSTKVVSVNGIAFTSNNTYVHSLSPGGGRSNYIDGLGMTRDTYWMGYSKWIAYYNKGNVEFGDSLNYDALDNTFSIQKYTVNLNVFPNPTNNLLNFQFKAPIDNAEIRIYSSIGQLVGQTALPLPQTVQFEVSDWSSGMYFYGVYVEGVLVKQGQVLVEH